MSGSPDPLCLPRGVRKTAQSSASVQRVDLAPGCAPAGPLQIDQIVRERRRNGHGHTFAEVAFLLFRGAYGFVLTIHFKDARAVRSFSRRTEIFCCEGSAPGAPPNLRGLVTLASPQMPEERAL
jgi:hypothetical protein